MSPEAGLPLGAPDPSGSSVAPGEGQFGAAVERLFGHENRLRLLDEYFDGEARPTPPTAWLQVYRLLMYIDPTNGLTHIYESDKSQPGKPWHPRAARFHAWLADQLGTSTTDLPQQIDWLFTQVIKAVTNRAAEAPAPDLAPQGSLLGDVQLPEPGSDPEMAEVIVDVLGGYLTRRPPPEHLRKLTRSVYSYLSQRNKRNNLIGEGFEDVAAEIIRRIPGAEGLPVYTRRNLGKLPGFHPPPKGAKGERVDLAICPPGRQRVLVSSKWSIRADRERQFSDDFATYVRHNAIQEPFRHVLLTNEFDAARLKRACEEHAQNSPLFHDVVHINPQGILKAYGPTARRSFPDVASYIATGRLTSFEAWLATLVLEP